MTNDSDTGWSRNPLLVEFNAFAFDETDHMQPRDYLYQIGVDLSFEAHLIAVRGLLAKTKEADEAITAEIESLGRRIRTITDDDAHQDAEWHWIDCLHQSTFHAAAHSMAALGMLAPMLESIFHQCFRAICQRLEESNQLPAGHPRWEGNQERRYDCRSFWVGDRFKTNLVEGVDQMAELLGLTGYFPCDYKRVIDALFLYRNKMFHNGFEWPRKERLSFAKAISEKGFPEDWFSKSTSGDDPVSFKMTDVFITKSVKTIEEVLDGIGRYAKNKLVPA